MKWLLYKTVWKLLKMLNKASTLPNKFIPGYICKRNEKVYLHKKLYMECSQHCYS